MKATCPCSQLNDLAVVHCNCSELYIGNKEHKGTILSGTTWGLGSNCSAESSVISLRSPPTEPSSSDSRVTLVNEGIRWALYNTVRAPTHDTLEYPMGSNLDDKLSPEPLRLGRSCPHRVPVQPNEWNMDKPLPPLPSGITTPIVRDVRQRWPRPYRMHHALPNNPLPSDLAALDQAFKRAGPQLRTLRHAPTPYPVPDSQTIDGASPASESAPPPRAQPPIWCSWVFNHGRRAMHPGSGLHRAAPERPSWHQDFLARISRRLRRLGRPAPLGQHSSRPYNEPTAVAPSDSDQLGPPPIYPLPPQSNCRTRTQRVLSALMGHQFTFDFTDAATPEQKEHIEYLLLQAERLFLSGLREIPRYSEQEDQTMSPRSDIYEMDGASSIPWRALWVTTMRRIMQEVHSLDDLFALALINRVAYTAFKANELSLIKATVWRISPAAWELRQVSEVCWGTAPQDGAQSLAAGLYLRHFTKDLRVLDTMKCLLRDHSYPILCKGTVAALHDPSSPRGAEIEAALWRIWTFCHLFGSRKNRELDFVGQLQWLRGETVSNLPNICRTTPHPTDFHTVLFTPPKEFALGNLGGLTVTQLCDLIEVWTAVAALVDFLREETDLAREHGIFNVTNIPPGDRSQERVALGAWVDFILTLGPTAVLELAPRGPNSSPDTAFVRAKANGWNHWCPPALSSPHPKFLTGIINRVLRSALDCQTTPNSFL